MAMTKTLDDYLALPRLTNNHFRYMPDEVKAALIERTPGCAGTSLDERVQWLRAGRTEYPTCEHCRKPLTSANWYASTTKKRQAEGWPSKGYTRFCSVQCTAKSDHKRAAVKRTSLERYGVEHPLQAEEVQAKRKLTNLERYGMTNPQAWSSERFKHLVHELHGVTSVRSIEGVSAKIAETKSIQSAALLAERAVELEKLFDVVLLDTIPEKIQRIDDLELRWRHECGREYSSNITARGLRGCPRCSASTSRAERELGDWVEQYGFEVSRRDTKTLGVELDLYIPALRIGIEYDGTYWHSAKFISAAASMRKLELAEKNNIQLITVQEHAYMMRREQVLSRLSSLLGKNRRVYARSGQTRTISVAEANVLFQQAHLQGGARAQFAVGFFLDGVLSAAMSFSRPRFSSKAVWELIRYASLPGVSVVGGASKLLKTFRTDHEGSILSYADRCWSTGALYKELGFEFTGTSAPSYFWVSGKHGIFTRYQTQKKKLPKLLELCGLPFDAAFSEDDNMRLGKFLKVYDRGNTVWLLK